MWTPATGMIGLGIPAGQSGSRAYTVSADGATVIGISWGTLVQGFVWTAADGMVLLPPLPGDSVTKPQAVSSDGKIIVGRSGNRPVIWRNGADPELLAELAQLERPDHIWVSAIRRNGDRLFGMYLENPFVWDKDSGFMYLQDLLAQLNVVPAVSWFQFAPFVSEDGLSVTGYVQIFSDPAAGRGYSYLARLIPILKGDLNDDDKVDLGDLVLMMRFVLKLQDPTEAQMAAGDINTDQQLDLGDALLLAQQVLSP